MSDHSTQGRHISNINACTAVADAVRSTLGPRGMEKLIHDDKGSTNISNDGATIMKLLKSAQPAAMILVDIAKSQDSEAIEKIRDLALSFEDRDIFCAGRVTEEDLQRVAAATGGTVQTSVKNVIEEFIEEAERSLHEEVMIVSGALKNSNPVAGGGPIDMEISRYLRQHSRTIAG